MGKIVTTAAEDKNLATKMINEVRSRIPTDVDVDKLIELLSKYDFGVMMTDYIELLDVKEVFSDSEIIESASEFSIGEVFDKDTIVEKCKEYRIEDVYDSDTLEKWALANGFEKKVEKVG